MILNYTELVLRTFLCYSVPNFGLKNEDLFRDSQPDTGQTRFYRTINKAIIPLFSKPPRRRPPPTPHLNMPISPANPSIDKQESATEESRPLSAIYSLLAMTMRYPDPAFFTEEYLDTLEAFADSLDWPEALAEFRAWRTQPIDLLSDLRTEYTRLFINGAPRAALPPYASVYLDGDRSLSGKTTERTRQFYRERGYALVSESEPADHLAHELDFLAALTGEGRFEDEQLFLKTLFRPWFRRFQEKSKKEARHPFFKVSLQLIDVFTKEEQ